MRLGTTQDIIQHLMNEYCYSINHIAQKSGISRNTVKRIQQGLRVSGKTDLQLIQLYCSIKS